MKKIIAYGAGIIAAFSILILPAVFAQNYPTPFTPPAATSTPISSTVALPTIQNFHVQNSGFAYARGVVTDIGSSTISMTSWGMPISLNLSSSTILVRQLGEFGALSEIKTGDDIRFYGFVSNTNPLAVDAQRIRDLSLLETTISGVISNLGSNGFTLILSNGAQANVTVYSNTSIAVNGTTTSFSSLRNGYRASVFGILNKNDRSDIAYSVKAFNP